MALQQRLTKELEDNPLPVCQARPTDSSIDMTDWIGLIPGPEVSPYQGGTFHFAMQFHEHFPFKPFEIRFTTPIHHPYINSKDEFYLDMIQKDMLWKIPINDLQFFSMIGNVHLN